MQIERLIQPTYSSLVRNSISQKYTTTNSNNLLKFDFCTCRKNPYENRLTLNEVICERIKIKFYFSELKISASTSINRLFVFKDLKYSTSVKFRSQLLRRWWIETIKFIGHLRLATNETQSDFIENVFLQIKDQKLKPLSLTRCTTPNHFPISPSQRFVYPMSTTNLDFKAAA